MPVTLFYKPLSILKFTLVSPSFHSLSYPHTEIERDKQREIHVIGNWQENKFLHKVSNLAPITLTRVQALPSTAVARHSKAYCAIWHTKTGDAPQDVICRPPSISRSMSSWKPVPMSWLCTP